LNHGDTEAQRKLCLCASVVLSKSKSKQRTTNHDADVLLAVDGEAHWAGGNRGAEIRLPQHLSIARIEGVERTVSTSAEQDVRRRRENSSFGRRCILTEIPFLLAGLWVERFDRAVSIVTARAAFGE